MSTHVYTPLGGSKHIRLLQFDCEVVPKDQQLEIRLIEADLTDGADFEALSYTWGDPKNKVPISIDGKILYITSHLDAFLRHLSQQLSEDDGVVRSYWADQICIDQQNTQERNKQVALM